MTRLTGRTIVAGGVVLFVALSGLVLPVRAAGVSRCLPVEAGETLARLYQDGTLRRLGPAGATLEYANILKVELDIGYRDSAGGQLGVVLKVRETGTGGATGRWFTFAPYDRRGPLSTELDRALLAVARAVDAAYELDPWIECRAAPVDPMATGSKGGSAPFVLDPPTEHSGTRDFPVVLYPRWLFLALGALALFLVSLGLVVSLGRGQKQFPTRPSE